VSAGRLQAAVAAGVLGVDDTRRELLQSIVDMTRAVFGARAVSIMLYDAGAHELVFEAVSGEGEESLVGQRIPAGTGIAGWVLASEESMVVDDVTQNPHFARQFAESTGYVPEGMLSVPLLYQEDVLGVLNVLDRQPSDQSSIEEMALLGRFANQAALAVSVAHQGQRARRALEDMDDDSAAVARLAQTLERLDGSRRLAARRLLEVLDELLTT
jgi:GAF domain-containing protein